MNEPIISEHAKFDLNEIWIFVARQNQRAADTLLKKILERVNDQAEFPFAGRGRDDLSPGLRSFVVSPYVVFYRVLDDTLEIVRVLHGSRDIDAIIKKMELD